MKSSLGKDLKRLGALAYHRLESGGPRIRRYHKIRREKGAGAARSVAPLYQWMFVPLTLWPFNIEQVFDAGMDRVSAGKALDKEMRFLMEILPAPPSDEVCAAVAEHEHDVRLGRYEGIVRTTAKFDEVERTVSLDHALSREWDRIKGLWDVNRYRNQRGIIHRTFSPERNLRELSVNWTRRDERFQAVFDAFCLRWNLYGMRANDPLLIKLSVNLTAHGTMIFIPAYWSFDASRDVRWDAVTKLHRVRSAKKQGPALAEGREYRRAMAAKLKDLDREVKRLRLLGAKRHAFLCKGLGLVEGTDPKRIIRLRKEFDRTLNLHPQS